MIAAEEAIACHAMFAACAETQTDWDDPDDDSQANSGMAGGAPQRHVDWLGHRLGDRSDAASLARSSRLNPNRHEPHMRLLKSLMFGIRSQWGSANPLKKW